MKESKEKNTQKKKLNYDVHKTVPAVAWTTTLKTIQTSFTLFTHVILLLLEPFLKIVFLGLQSVDVFVQFLCLLLQFVLAESADLEGLDPLLQNGALLRLKLFLRLALRILRIVSILCVDRRLIFSLSA